MTIRYLIVKFANSLERWELPAFRGAVIAKAGNEHRLFHNHLSDREYMYGYPVIQYKMEKGYPMLVCLDYGVEESLHFFNKPRSCLN